MSAYFITATGTGIGKTFVTAGLVRHLRGAGEVASALKPVISGIDETNFAESDSGVLLDAMDEAVTADSITRISPWRFKEPISPDMAAVREGRSIDFSALVDFTKQAIADHQGTLLIEGVGGVMVPLDNEHTVLDWMAALKIPVVLVTGSYLGTISHTLTALAALGNAGLKPTALVVNESEGSVGLGEIAQSLKPFTDVPLVEIGRNATDSGSFLRVLGR